VLPNSRCVLPLALALALAPAARAQDAVMLRLDPPVGQVSRYRMEIQSWIRGRMLQADTSLPTFVQIIHVTQTVGSVEGDVRVITTVIDSSRMDAPGMGGMGQLGQMAGDMLRGQTTTTRVDARGRVLSVEVAPNPNLPPMLAGRMGGATRGLGRRGEMSLPMRLVHVGESWTDSLNTELGGGRGAPSEAMTSVTYRLERIERQGASQLAVISWNGTMSSTPADQASGTTVSGSMSGEFVVDVSAGRLARMTTEANGQVESQAGGRMPVRTRVTMTLLP